jgi:hypothetical protein
MKPIKARQLSKIQHLVPNNPRADLQLTGGKDLDDKVIERERKRTLYDSSYRTAAGHWKQRDEPSSDEQLRQSDRINQLLSARRKKEAQERLRSKGAVPTKQGKKLFDEFMKEANAHRTQPVTKVLNISSSDLDELQNLYNSASALKFEQWVVFIADKIALLKN